MQKRGIAMDTKKYFSQVFVMEGCIGKLLEKIETLRAKQISPGDGDGLGVQRSRNYRRSEDISIAIMELETQLAKEKLALLNLETEIRSIASNLLCPMARAVITWRYICRLKWKDIAERAEMSEMQTIREHNIAMEQMDQPIIYTLTNSIAN